MSSFDESPGCGIIIIIAVAAIGIAVAMFVFPMYGVWQQQKAGESELARADSNRKIATLEANAKLESSKALAEAEIVRAKGVAEANRIIGDSLKGNESYLHYLWIHNMAETKNQVIYVPTEANLPILEAGHRMQVKAAKP